MNSAPRVLAPKFAESFCMRQIFYPACRSGSVDSVKFRRASRVQVKLTVTAPGRVFSRPRVTHKPVCAGVFSGMFVELLWGAARPSLYWSRRPEGHSLKVRHSFIHTARNRFAKGEKILQTPSPQFCRSRLRSGEQKFFPSFAVEEIRFA